MTQPKKRPVPQKEKNELEPNNTREISRTREVVKTCDTCALVTLSTQHHCVEGKLAAMKGEHKGKRVKKSANRES